MDVDTLACCVGFHELRYGRDLELRFGDGNSLGIGNPAGSVLGVREGDRTSTGRRVRFVVE